MTVDIKNMKKVEHNKIRANFTIVLDECITIYNCKLIYSEKKNQFYAFCPSFQYGDSYFNLVRFSDPLHSKVLDAAIIAYTQLS